MFFFWYIQWTQLNLCLIFDWGWFVSLPFIVVVGCIWCVFNYISRINYHTHWWYRCEKIKDSKSYQIIPNRIEKEREKKKPYTILYFISIRRFLHENNRTSINAIVLSISLTRCQFDMCGIYRTIVKKGTEIEKPRGRLTNWCKLFTRQTIIRIEDHSLLLISNFQINVRNLGFLLVFNS